MASIHINGKEYPVKFGLSVVMRFAIEEGMKTFDEFEKWLSSIDKTGQNFETIVRISKLFYAGIKRGCLRENVEFDLEEDDLVDQLIVDPEVYTSLIEMMTLSIVPQDIGKQPAENTGKAKKKK